MEEKLPAERGEVRTEISELVEAEGWLPAVTASAVDPEPEDDEPQRPETD